MTIADGAMKKLKKIYEGARENSNFGNGRFVRKMLEEAEMNLAERVAQLKESEITEKLLTTIEEEDIPEAEEKKEKGKKQMGFFVA